MTRQKNYYKMGKAMRLSLIQLGGAWAGFAESWDVFSKSLGWFQHKKKHNLTDDDIEEFKRGFEEALDV